MMKRSIPLVVCGLAAVVFVLSLLGGSDRTIAAAADGDGPVSPLAIVASEDGKTLYVAQATGQEVALVDAASGEVKKTISCGADLNGLALSEDGKTLAATTDGPAGKICLIDVASGKTRSISAGHTPTSPNFSPDGKTLYVCNRFDNEVAFIDVSSGKTTKTAKVPREPVAADLTADGKKLVVANLLPAGAADEAYVAATVSVIHTDSAKVVPIQLPNGSMSLRGACVSPDGKNAYVTHILGRYQLPTTQLDRGWMNTNALSIIDLEKDEIVNTVLLDDIDRGAANPWGVAVSKDGKTIGVACSGTHEVILLDRDALHKKLAEAAEGKQVTQATDSAEDVPNDLAFCVDLKKRIKLGGNGPRGLTAANGKFYAAEYFTDTISVVNPQKDPVNVQQYAMNDGFNETRQRYGEKLFNDAIMCFQHWQSCATCHPDARTDGLNWDLLNDGIGNPKQTKSMLLSHKTPPVMVTGIRPDAETAVRAGMTYIQFVVRPESEAVAIDTYLKSLEPVPSPYLVDGKLSKAAQRGQALFEQAGCAGCHPAPLYTDLQKHDVGTGIGREAGMAFDTPTLVEIWRTEPYLYDGRSPTMLQCLTKDNPQLNAHGDVSGMSKQQIADLVEYVLSL
jgi:YVTN family beta-propeller protein